MCLWIFFCRWFENIFENTQQQKSKTNATILSYKQFEDSADNTAEKSHTNAISAISVTTNLNVQTFWGNIWKHTPVKSQTNAKAKLCIFSEDTFQNTQQKNKCNQCYCASFQKRLRRTHLKKYWIGFSHTLRKRLNTHNMEKSNKCNQCAYKSSHVDNLRTYLKTPMQL